MTRVTFQIKRHVEPGFVVAIAGSGAELGEWRVSHQMGWTSGDTWVLETQLVHPECIEYKYQIVDQTSSTIRQWEASGNRRLKPIPTVSLAVRVVDVWDVPQFSSQEIQETAKVHLRRTNSQDRV